MMQGWSYDQICDDMNKYADTFNKIWNSICNNLAAGAYPLIFKQLGMSGNKNQPNESIRQGLVFYINDLLSNTYNNLEHAYKAYEKQLIIEREKQIEREAEFDEWWESRREQRQN